MASGERKLHLNRRDALKLVGAGGLAAGFSRVPFSFAAASGTSLDERAVHSPEMPWYAQELIRGHTSWIHPTWTRPEKDFDATKWIDQFERAGFRSFVFYSKFHDGVCNWPSKFQELKPERDFIGEITTEAHRRQMRVIIYYSAGPDEYAADRHPDWRCVRRDGSVVGKIAPGNKGWFKFPFCCPNSPYGDYALGQIEEILTQYDVDGIWMDVMVYPELETDPEHQRRSGCFCIYCRQKYSLRTGGGSLFDIDGTPEQDRWGADSWREFFSGAKEIVRKKGSNKTITFNGCGRLRRPHYWPDLYKLGDYISMEGFYFAQVQIGSTCRLARSAGKPYEIICVASGQSIGWTPKSPDLILLEAATVTAHGGTYCVAMDPTPSGKLFDMQIDQVAAAAAHLRKRQDWLIGTSPVYDAAVFHPSYLAPTPADSDATALSQVSQGWPDLLAQRNIPFAYLYPDSDLSPFQLVILDRSFPISEQLVDRVMAYVKGGGNVLAELSPGQLDSPAGKRLLWEVLGVRILGPTGYEAVYLGRLDQNIAEGISEIPTLVEGPSYLLQPTTAQPLAYYTYPLAPWSLHRMTFVIHNAPSDKSSDHVAITLNHYGKGLAAFVACSLGGEEIRRHQNVVSDPRPILTQVHEWALQLGENLVLRLIAEPLFKSSAPAGVEIVVNQQTGKHVVHFLNGLLVPMLFCDNRPGRIELANISFSINENRVGRVHRVVTTDGQDLSISRQGKWARVAVPNLKVHEILAFFRQ